MRCSLGWPSAAAIWASRCRAASSRCWRSAGADDNPRLLILDEATRPGTLIRDEIWNCLSMLKARGQSVLVIDKNVENLTRIADRITSSSAAGGVERTSEQLIAEPDLQHRYLGI